MPTAQTVKQLFVGPLEGAHDDGESERKRGPDAELNTALEKGDTILFQKPL